MIDIPSPKKDITPPALYDYLSRLVRALHNEFGKRPVRNTAVGSVELVSPNGSVYTVAVTDAGVLSVTKVLDNAP